MSIPPLYLSIDRAAQERDEADVVDAGGGGVEGDVAGDAVGPRALGLLLDGLSLWFGAPLIAVLDADAADVQENPGRWTLLLADLGPHSDVEWAIPTTHRLRSTVGGLGDFRRAHRLLASVRGQR